MDAAQRSVQVKKTNFLLVFFNQKKAFLFSHGHSFYDYEFEHIEINEDDSNDF